MFVELEHKISGWQTSYSQIQQNERLRVMLDNIDFRNLTKREAKELILDAHDPKTEPLARWIAESIAWTERTYQIRVAIAEGERDVEKMVM